MCMVECLRDGNSDLVAAEGIWAMITCLAAFASS
jgi:hypothetical protein